MNYIAWLKQDGGGCDFTIGCGFKLLKLQSKDFESAILELKRAITGIDGDKVDATNGYTGDSALERITLFAVSSEYSIDPAVWYAERDEMLSDKAVKYIEQEERKEYERLKRKFGE